MPSGIVPGNVENLMMRISTGWYVFSSDTLDRHWAELDAFEGEEYRRVPVIAKTKDGRSLEACIYVLSEW